eukprot:gene11716-84_t
MVENEGGTMLSFWTRSQYMPTPINDKLKYARGTKCLPDPYQLNFGWSDSPRNWPDITFGDIFMYLIETPGSSTREEMKAYKSLEAYKRSKRLATNLPRCMSVWYNSMLESEETDTASEDECCGIFPELLHDLFEEKFCNLEASQLASCAQSLWARQRSVEEAANEDPDFCLDKSFILKHNHRYYTQVQFQMYILEVQYSDFVIATDVNKKIIRVSYNHQFCTNLASLSKRFFFDNVLPEIITKKLYSERAQSTTSDEDLWCVCREVSVARKLLER